MLGQPASWHTVCRPSLFTSRVSSRYCGPVFSLVLIHGGLRSIGVSLLRTSSRRSLRPSGVTAVTRSPLCSREPHPSRVRRGPPPHDPPRCGEMIMSTMNDLPGYDVIEVVGDVFGLTVFVKGAGSSIEAGIRTIFGGEARGLTDQLPAAGEDARRKLIAAAEG